MTESPNAPRSADPLTRQAADTIARIERNYDREGSGPGSRFEGRLREDVQAEAVVRLVRAAVRETAAVLARETLPEVRWAPYREFGIPDPAQETSEPPAHPFTVGATGYRGSDVIVYWKQAGAEA